MQACAPTFPPETLAAMQRAFQASQNAQPVSPEADDAAMQEAEIAGVLSAARARAEPNPSLPASASAGIMLGPPPRAPPGIPTLPLPGAPAAAAAPAQAVSALPASLQALQQTRPQATALPQAAPAGTVEPENPDNAALVRRTAAKPPSPPVDVAAAAPAGVAALVAGTNPPHAHPHAQDILQVPATGPLDLANPPPRLSPPLYRGPALAPQLPAVVPGPRAHTCLPRTEHPPPIPAPLEPPPGPRSHPRLGCETWPTPSTT